jgi:sugar phosphate isomerase/epimerase
MSLSSALSRRQFVQFGLAGVASAALAAKIHSVVDGLHIGIQTYSLRGLRYPDLVSAIQQAGIGECELFSAQVEPAAADVPDIMKWRDTVSLDFFKDIRKKFNQAGIDIYTYNPRFGAGGGGRGRGGPNAAPANGPAPAGASSAPGAPAAPPATPPAAAPPPPQITDAQIDRIFEFTKALGAKTISSALSLDMAKRIVPFAEKHKMLVAVSSTNPDILTQVPPISPYLRIDLDIGDFTRAGHDSLQFVKDNYEHLLDIHLKDCKFKGPSVPFGTGDSHMKEILQFLRDKKTQIRANVDCDYPGTGTSVDEVKKSFDYVKSCLA